MSFDFKKDPFENFLKLYKAAEQKGVPDANAMALATVSEKQQPSVRIVYFKNFLEVEGDRGFCFFTNYDGKKGVDLEANPKAGANFFWPHLDQQVRIEGYVKKISRTESEKYFAGRPRLSQLGAWSSHQSERIEKYEILMTRLKATEEKYINQKIPCPPHWGGYVLVPTEFEFWFGKAGRLHERYVYQWTLTRDWERFMRSP